MFTKENCQERLFSLRPIHIIKYTLWYIIFSMLITYILIDAGEIVISKNDSVFWYMLLHDALQPFILLLVTILTGYLINFATSETITHKFAFKRAFFSFKHKFQVWLADFVILTITASYLVVNRMTNVEVISSKDKLSSILVLLACAYFIKFIFWLIYKGLKNEFIRLGNIVVFALSLPATLFQQISEEIFNSPLPTKYKKVFLTLLRIMCMILLGFIICTLISIFIETTKQFIK